MRQALLGWVMVRAGEYGCRNYLRLQVIPNRNAALRDKVRPPSLKNPGSTCCPPHNCRYEPSVADIWRTMANNGRLIRFVPLLRFKSSRVRAKERDHHEGGLFTLGPAQLPRYWISACLTTGRADTRPQSPRAVRQCFFGTPWRNTLDLSTRNVLRFPKDCNGLRL